MNKKYINDDEYNRSFAHDIFQDYMKMQINFLFLVEHAEKALQASRVERNDLDQVRDAILCNIKNIMQNYTNLFEACDLENSDRLVRKMKGE